MQKCSVTPIYFSLLLFTCIATKTFSQEVGIGTTTPDQDLEIEGTGDQILSIHTLDAGISKAGLDLNRDNAFSATDWRIVNDGGTLNFLDAINNFTGAADLNMTLSQNGNLGLGTGDPLSHLHISGSTDQLLKIHRTTDGTGLAGIDLLRYNEFSATDWRIVNDGGTFKILDATNNFIGAADQNLTITSSGNVGIGIIAPEAPLHVDGTNLISETGNGFFQLGDPAGNHLRFDNNEILARNGDNTALLFLQFWSGNLSLCDDNAGRVGIGTSSPQSKVHIVDGADVSLTGGGELVLGATTGPNIAMDGNEIQARNNGAGSSLFLQTSAGDVLMIPNETGQVGIGVASSLNMPADDYLLAVDGKIISEEVRVEISGSWPDYVFDQDYRLTPLSELENQLKSQGHLPGIPSAAQVKEEGILLGDMQRAMLEKIEELTLYVIALQKEIDDLKSQPRLSNDKKR